MDKRQIFHLQTILAQSLSRHWTVEEMAGEIGQSVSHFHQDFKAHFQKTPLVYLHDLRLENAREMLQDATNFDCVKEIAYRVGLTDESHFTRDFKKKFGLTPTDYRIHFFENRGSKD